MASPWRQSTHALILFACALGAEASATRKALLEAVVGTQRGLAASAARRAEVSTLVTDLAAASPERAPLKSPRLAGSWRLLYTTDRSALGEGRPEWRKPRGDLMQLIDTSDEPWLLRTSEGFPLFATVTAALRPAADLSGHRARLNLIEQQSLGGLLTEVMPEGTTSTVEFLYLDDELLVSRADGGHLFVSERAGPAPQLKRLYREGKGYYQGSQYFSGMFNTVAPAPFEQAANKQLDSLLPNLKAAGMATGLVAALVASFLASNGLLPGQGGLEVH